MRAASPARQRRSHWARSSRASTLHVGVAQETAVRDAAFRLVHDQYVWRGFMSAPHWSGRRVDLRHALPSTRVFVVQDDARVVGTASVFHDSPLGLPMDEVFADQLAVMRAAGRRVAEVSALAMDGDRRAYGLPVLMRLLRVVLLYASSVARLDDLCLVVRPQHASLYKQLRACRVMGEPRRYAKVNTDRVVALHIDLHELRAMFDAVRAGERASNAVEALMAGAGFSDIVADLELEAPAAALTAEQFVEFFLHGDVLTQASTWTRLYLASLHGFASAAAADGAAAEESFEHLAYA